MTRNPVQEEDQEEDEEKDDDQELREDIGPSRKRST